MHRLHVTVKVTLRGRKQTGLGDRRRVALSGGHAGRSLGPWSLLGTGQGGRGRGGLGSLLLQGRHQGTEVRLPEAPHRAIGDHGAAHLAVFLEILLKQNLSGIRLHIDANRPQTTKTK